MKKSFTFFAISALFLMLLFPVSVKADPIVKSFAIPNNGWNTSTSSQEACAGNISNQNNIINSGDFYWSGVYYSAAQRDDDAWTGIAKNTKCCSRQEVTFSASSYTISVITKWKGEEKTVNLPKIIINGNDYYVTRVVENSESQSFSNNQWGYARDNSTWQSKEATLEYDVNLSSGGGNYTISLQTADDGNGGYGGDKDKYLFKTLTITPNCTQHTVTVAADDNNKGTVAGGGSYCEYSEVTVTATPNAGYNFVNWTDNNNSNSEVSTNASYTFTLTANVSYRANFAACEGAAVTVNRNNNDYGTVNGEGSYCAGSQVNLTATPNSGYRFVNWTVTSGSASLDNVNNASTHFTMSNPAAAVTVQANFEVDPCTNTKTVQCVSGYVPVTIYSNAEPYVENKHDTYVVTNHDKSAYYYPLSLSTTISSFTLSIHMANSQHDYAWFNLYKKTANNSGDVEYDGAYYNKVGWQHMVASNDWNSGEFDDAITSFNDGQQGVGSSIPAGDYLLALSAKNDAKFYYFTLTASENIFCPNTITMAKSGDDGAAAPTAQVNSSNVTTAFEGAVVTVTAAAASANHYFSGWTVSPENAVTFDEPASPTTTFVMPAEDVTITANYGEVVSSALTFSAVEGGSITSATAGGNDISSGDNVVSGTSVTLTAAANSNYVFINWTDNNNSDAVVSTNAAFTFSMPAASTAYTAHFAQIDNVISQGSETGSSTYHDGATMEESHMDDFGAFGHSVLKLSYSNMTGGNYYGWNIGKNGSYSSTNSAGATGFGFYYKTETDADKVAFCFDHGDHNNQYKVELPATNNVWKYHYFDQSAANGWNGSNIVIFINGTDGGNTTANANGAIYLADIAATSIISKPEINTYTYTRANASNSYGTLCLPMAGSVSGATLYSVAGKQEEGGKLYIVLEEKDATLAAGEPYIFETDGSTLTATMSGPHSPVKANANGLVGTYQLITAPAYSAPNNLNYVLALDNSNNTVFKRVGENVTVGAYRAYINIQNAGDYSPASAAPGRKYIRFGIEGTEEEQAVEMIYDDASLRTRKIMQNGHLYILRDGHLFTAQGTRIK